MRVFNNLYLNIEGFYFKIKDFRGFSLISDALE
ncbi:hypothetical protein VSDKYIMU_CDS0146 [Enterococcus phage VRE9_4]